MKRKFKLFILTITFALVAFTLFSCNSTPNSLEKGEIKCYGIIENYTDIIGNEFKPLEFITLEDEYNKDITNLLKVMMAPPVDENNCLSEIGTFKYLIVASRDNMIIYEKEITINVIDSAATELDNVKPVINANETYVFSVGDELKITATAIDDVDNDITHKIIYNGINAIPTNDNILTKEGRYTVTIEVSDNAGNKAIKTITIIVNKKAQYDEINRHNLVIEEFKNVDKLTSGDNYLLVWSDEFDVDGAPNSDYWGYEIGTGNWGWGNGEAQYYTNRSQNVKVENNNLKITLKRENYGGSQFTSTRMVSRNKVDIKYGKIEFRAMLPSGGGTWPALWMMPTKSVYGGWPNSGEIDVMEHVGNRQDYILGTCHMGAYNGGNGRGKTIYAKGVSTSFNTYAIEWTPDKISFLFNDEVYYTYSNPRYENDNQKVWPFDQEFYVIMNVAIGGTLGGNIDPNFMESSMLVDYVRVYQKDYTNSDTIKPNEVVINKTTSSANQIELGWNKVVDNVGIHHYEIILNGEHIASTIKTTYTVKNLNPNTPYYLRVIAVDLAGNYTISDEKIVQTTSLKTVSYIPKKEDFYETI